jgi:hypothetical protein
MRIHGIALLAGTLIAAAPALCGEGLRGPVTGFVRNQTSHTVRPVNGMPGAAVLGQPLELPFGLLQSAARSRDVVVGISDETPHRATIVRIVDGAATAAAIDGSLTGADGLVLSGSGTAAAIYTADTLQVIAGLPNAPQAGAAIALPGAVSAAAVSDDGTVVLFASVAPGAAGLYRSLDGAAAVQIGGNGGITALEILNGGRDAAALDATARQVSLIADVRNSAAPILLADAETGVDSPVALAATRDGRLLVVANRESRTALLVDVTSAAAPRAIAVGGQTGGCVRIGQEDVFLLSEVPASPLYVLDLNDLAGNGRVFFVPVE